VDIPILASVIAWTAGCIFTFDKIRALNFPAGRLEENYAATRQEKLFARNAGGFTG
jgi:hypothetical protein